MDAQQVTELLEHTRDIRRAAPAEDYLSGIFTKPMGAYMLKRAYRRVPEKTADITGLERLAETIKHLYFPVTGTAGFERSQVTKGGIAADEINSDLGFVRIPGMYVCGEMTDIFGDCGGYNLDFAFSSGAIAGKNAALSLKKRH